MTNKIFFKEEIFEVACGGTHIAVDKKTNKPRSCKDISCSDCALRKDDTKCKDAFLEWLNTEYGEPCPFEIDELVEVSDDGKNWYLRHFSHKEKDKCYVFTNGAKSNENHRAVDYPYCRKYGTLGGLVKGE